MMKKTIFAFTAIGLLAFSVQSALATAVAPPEKDGPGAGPRGQKAFDRWDANGDGAIDKKEFNEFIDARSNKGERREALRGPDRPDRQRGRRGMPGGKDAGPNGRAPKGPMGMRGEDGPHDQGKFRRGVGKMLRHFAAGPDSPLRRMIRQEIRSVLRDMHGHQGPRGKRGGMMRHGRGHGPAEFGMHGPEFGPRGKGRGRHAGPGPEGCPNCGHRPGGDVEGRGMPGGPKGPGFDGGPDRDEFAFRGGPEGHRFAKGQRGPREGGREFSERGRRGPKGEGPMRGKGNRGGNREGRFERLDKNKDGVIDAEEFKGPDERFDRLDRNDDDRLDKEEFARPGKGGNGAKGGKGQKGAKGGKRGAKWDMSI